MEGKERKKGKSQKIAKDEPKNYVFYVMYTADFLCMYKIPIYILTFIIIINLSLSIHRIHKTQQKEKIWL